MGFVNRIVEGSMRGRFGVGQERWEVGWVGRDRCGDIGISVLGVWS